MSQHEPLYQSEDSDDSCHKYNHRNFPAPVKYNHGNSGYRSDDDTESDTGHMKVTPEHEPPKNTKAINEIRCTLFTIWCIWFCIFAAYNPLEILQSSLNPEIGLYSVSLVYGSTFITSLMAPAIIRTITARGMIIVACLSHSSLVLANFYPSWYTLIPGGLIVGLITAPFWTCYSCYITALAVRYGKLTNQTKVAVLSKFNGYISTTMPLSFSCGNFLSSFILKHVRFHTTETNDSSHNSSVLNYTLSSAIEYTTSGILYGGNHTTDTEIYTDPNCGANYCPVNNNPQNESETLGNSQEKPHIYTVYVLVSVLACFNLCGVLLAVFVLKNLPNEELECHVEVKIDHKGKGGKLEKYLKLLFDWRLLLLGPGMAYLHIQHSLYFGMFPKAYISCSVGIDSIGYVSMVVGLSSLVTHPLSGFLGQYIHRNILLLFSFILVLIKVILWLKWAYLPNIIVGLYSVAIISGVSGANSAVQFAALVGDIFTEKKVEAFSFIHFLSGFIVALGFISIKYICVFTQLMILLLLMLIALISYTILMLSISRTGTSSRPGKYTQLQQLEQNVEELVQMIGHDSQEQDDEEQGEEEEVVQMTQEDFREQDEVGQIIRNESPEQDEEDIVKKRSDSQKLN